MSTLTFRPVKDIGYKDPVGYNFEYCKFDSKQSELENNEIELPSEDEDDDEYEGCITTDDSESDLSESDFYPRFIKKRKRAPIIEKIYSVVLQEEDFLPE